MNKLKNFIITMTVVSICIAGVDQLIGRTLDKTIGTIIIVGIFALIRIAFDKDEKSYH